MNLVEIIYTCVSRQPPLLSHPHYNLEVTKVLVRYRTDYYGYYVLGVSVNSHKRA